MNRRLKVITEALLLGEERSFENGRFALTVRFQ
jgi:hypothetical protein